MEGGRRSRDGADAAPGPARAERQAARATLAPSDNPPGRHSRRATLAPGDKPPGQTCGSCTGGTLSDAGSVFPAELAPGEPYVAPGRAGTPGERSSAAMPARPEQGARRRHGSGRGRWLVSRRRTPHTLPVVQVPQVRRAREPLWTPVEARGGGRAGRPARRAGRTGAGVARYRETAPRDPRAVWSPPCVTRRQATWLRAPTCYPPNARGASRSHLPPRTPPRTSRRRRPAHWRRDPRTASG